MAEAERIVFVEAKLNALTLLVTALLGVLESEREEGVAEELETRLTTWQERSAVATTPLGESAQHLALGLLSRLRKPPAPKPGPTSRVSFG